MKKLVLSFALVGLGTLAMAQQTQKKEITPEQKAKFEQKKAERFEKMKADLKLSDAQVSQIKALQEQNKGQREKMMAERKAQMQEHKAKREQMQADMKKILTPEQYVKWEQMKKENMRKKTTMVQKKKMHKPMQ